MTHPLRMRICLPAIAIAVIAALALPAAAAASWSTVSEPPLTTAPFSSNNIGITDSPGGDYAPSTTNEVLSSPVTLPAGLYSTCELSYWRRVDLGPGDTFSIAVLLNGVPQVSASPQNHTTRRDAFIDLNSNFDGGGQVQIRLRLTSDSNANTVDDGVHMDNIKLFCHGSPSDNGYEFLDGTSMAAPMVSGAAALLFSDPVLNDPTPLTPSDVKNALLDTVDLTPGLAGNVVTGGRLNVYRALIGDINTAGGGGGGGGSASTGGGGSSSATSGDAQSPASDDSAADQPVVPGQVLVRYAPGSTAAARSDARAEAGTTAIEGLGMARAQLLKITDGDSVAATVRQLEAQPGVAYAEPNQLLQPASVPNDALFNQQWGLYNDGATVNGVTGTPDADIDAPEAWNVTTGDPATVVAVMDTGADLQHPDLQNELWTNPGDGSHGFDFVSNDSDPTDLTGHGTHVSGIVAAEGNNAIGVTGVAQHAALMELRICGTYSFGCPLSAEVDALNYAGDHGARVLNGSIQGSSFSQMAQDALAAHPDTLYVFAAGNGGSDGIGDDNDVTPTYPCALDQVNGYSENNVICVAATDQSDGLASFSNYGATSVDLGAPGVNILSTSSQKTFFSDDFQGGDFDVKWGSGSSSGTGGGSDTGSTTTTESTGTTTTNVRPNTFFNRKPGHVVQTVKPKARVVFKFGSTQSGSSFRCELDSVEYKPCSKRFVRRLLSGRHVLKVKAVASDGGIDPSAAVAKFRVKQIVG